MAFASHRVITTDDDSDGRSPPAPPRHHRQPSKRIASSPLVLQFLKNSVIATDDDNSDGMVLIQNHFTGPRLSRTVTASRPRASITARTGATSPIGDTLSVTEGIAPLRSSLCKSRAPCSLECSFSSSITALAASVDRMLLIQRGLFGSDANNSQLLQHYPPTSLGRRLRSVSCRYCCKSLFGVANENS